MGNSDSNKGSVSIGVYKQKLALEHGKFEILAIHINRRVLVFNS